MKVHSPLLVLLLVLAWAAVAGAGPQTAMQAEPKRSYGSVDVILYQTSW